MVCWPPLGVLTSSTPLEMPPWPSATKTPMRAKKSPVAVSEPLIEKTYWPLRLALVKPPTGGGGVTTEPLLPQATAKTAAERARKSARRFIERLPSAGQPEHLQEVVCCHEPRRG